MNRIVVNVLAWIGVGVIAGLLYWVGHFNGYSAGEEVGHFHGYSTAETVFHEWCQEVSIVTFKGDPISYLCAPTPPAVPYEHEMPFSTTTTEVDHIHVEYDSI